MIIATYQKNGKRIKLRIFDCGGGLFVMLVHVDNQDIVLKLKGVISGELDWKRE